MTADFVVNLDADAAAVLLDWLQREDAIDGFKWAAARPGDRVALKRLLTAVQETPPGGVDATQARERLEATLPPQTAHRVPEAILRHAPQHIRERLSHLPPGNDLVSRIADRLDLLGAPYSGLGWQRDGEHWYLEVGLDPYSEDTARRIRLMCEPIEVRIVEGPHRPRWPLGHEPGDST